MDASGEWNSSDPHDIEGSTEQEQGKNDDSVNKFGPIHDESQEQSGESMPQESPFEFKIQSSKVPHDDEKHQTKDSDKVEPNRSHVVSESPPKRRRRFQRRNSTTAKMMLESMTTIALLPLNEFDHEIACPSGEDHDVDNAEDLVRLVQAKRTKR